MTDTLGSGKLEIGLDASGVEAGAAKAKQSLKGLGMAAKDAADQAGQGFAQMGDDSNRASKKVETATTRLTNEIQRTITAFESGGRTSRQFYELLAQQKGINPEQFKPLLDQLDAAKAKQIEATTAMLGGTKQFNAYGLSAKQTAAALRQVPAQLTDIVVSLQGGQAPLTVLLQQGGQLRDVFGGIAPAARALGGAVLGLINPYTVAAAAIGSLAYGYYKGTQEADNFAKALILNNNASGTTIGQLYVMAENIAKVSGTQGEAAEALTAFANSGSIAGASMERFALVAVKANKLAGVAVQDTVKAFADLAKDPVGASEKLNETTRFLTISLYQQIKALQEQGKVAEAAALAQGAYAADQENKLSKLQDRLGYVERAWNAAGGAAKTAWDNFLDVGRPDTTEQKLARMQKMLEDFENTPQGKRTTEMVDRMNKAGGVDRLRENILGLQEMAANERKLGEIEAENAKRTQARIKFEREGEKYLENALKLRRELAEVENLRKDRVITDDEAKTRSSQLREEFAKKMDPEAMAGAKRDIEKIKALYADLTNNYVNAEKIMESTRAAGLIDEKEYFAAKRGFLELNAAAQIGALEAENVRLNAQKLSRKDALDRDRQVVHNLTEIGKLRAGLAASQVVLDTQETASLKAKEAALLAVRQAAQDYLAVQERQQARDVAAIGQGERQRKYDSGVNQIEDKYAAQRLELDNQRALLEMQGKFGADERKSYNDRLAVLQEFQGKALTSYRSYYDALKRAESDWTLGASEALKNYKDTASNAYASTNQVFTNGLKGMEDSLVSFITTGKGGFTDLANSIVADITRIIIKQQISNALGVAGGAGGEGGFIGQVFGALMGSKGSTNSPGGSGWGLDLGGRAIGGPVSPGGAYRVNENGPEILSTGGKQYLMMNGAYGQVTPVSGVSTGGSVTVHNTFVVGQNTDRRTQMQIAQMAGDSIRRAQTRNG